MIRIPCSVSSIYELKKSIFIHNSCKLIRLSPSTVFFDTHAIMNSLDFVVLDGFDYQTPERNPKEADYPSPLYDLLERNSQHNINSLVQWWLKNGLPGHKIVLGMPTYARTWKMTSDSAISGVPPLIVDGPAPEGNTYLHKIIK